MYNLDKNINMKNRNNSPGGKTLFVCDINNINNIELSTDKKYITDITIKNDEKKFYKYELPRNNLTFINSVLINVSNGCYLFNPKCFFKIPGLKKDKLELYDFLVRRSVVIIVRTNMNQYFVLGKDFGMDLNGNSFFTLGRGGTDLIGSNIEMIGGEVVRITEIDPDLVDDILNKITYVNKPLTLTATSI